MLAEGQSSEGSSPEILLPSEKLDVRFEYDPAMEVRTLRVAMGAFSHGGAPTPFGEMAEKAGVDIASQTEVVKFAESIIASEKLDMSALQAEFEAKWKPHEDRAQSVFSEIFSLQGTDHTGWSPGKMTAYLTLAQRCPYSTQGNYFFVSVGSKAPIMISLHEIMHFYSHKKLQPKFEAAGVPEKHEDFKEALTVLLNDEFADIMEREDRGYPQHQELRAWIKEQYSQGVSVATMADEYIGKLKSDIS